MADEQNSELRRRLLLQWQAFRSDTAGVSVWCREQGALWVLGLIVGAASAWAAVLFRKGISALQSLFYGSDDISRLHSLAESLPWYWVMIVPVVGGLAVGLILHFFTREGRAHSVADVIEGAALRDGRVARGSGLASALASLITLGTGGSSGREGPVVHMAAVIASWVSERVNASGVTARDLMGCGAAAAVSASFNAPIAGAIFALEVVLRHFAVHAFGPIVLASVAGTVISRYHFGDMQEFVLPSSTALEFYVELPAFFLLGLVCALVAVVMMNSIFFADSFGTALQSKYRVPRWLRPTVAGLLLGILAIWFTPIIGVGYETTANALTGRLLGWEALIIAVVKVIAVAITLGGRMGGGVFSPSLMLGALTGLVFGYTATAILPAVSGEATVYALAGMGAVAAAVLGAPISTVLIVFEMTGDWQVGLAVLASVSTSVTLSARLVKRSFFLTILERRNIHLAAGPQAYLLGMYGVAKLMRPLDDPDAPSEEKCWEKIETGVYVDVSATLEGAMPVLEQAGAAYVPVVAINAADSAPQLQGVLFYVDALKTYNRAMAAVSEEEHS